MLINLHFVVRSSWKRVSEWVHSQLLLNEIRIRPSFFLVPLQAHFYSSYEQLKKSQEFVDFNARACCTFYGLPPSPSASSWNGLRRSRIVLYCSSNSWPLLLTEHRLTTAVPTTVCCCCVLAQPTTSVSSSPLLLKFPQVSFLSVSDLKGWIKAVICKNSTLRRQRASSNVGQTSARSLKNSYLFEQSSCWRSLSMTCVQDGMWLMGSLPCLGFADATLSKSVRESCVNVSFWGKYTG